jgi:hypothetical protein
MKTEENNKNTTPILNEEFQNTVWMTPDEVADSLFQHLTKISEEMKQKDASQS